MAVNINFTVMSVYHLAEALSPVDNKCWLKPILLSSPQFVQSLLHNHPQFSRSAGAVKVNEKKKKKNNNNTNVEKT